MHLFIVFAYFQDQYEEGVEAIAIMDADSYEKNPEYLQEELKKARESSEYTAARLFRLRLNNNTTKQIIEALAEPVNLLQNDNINSIEVVDDTLEG